MIIKNVHAIGDRANGLVLDAFEAALKDANVTALRPRLEHAQILAEKDMARFGKLGGESVTFHSYHPSKKEGRKKNANSDGNLPGYSYCKYTAYACVSVIWFAGR